MAEFKETYPGAAFDADGKHRGPGPWLDVIRKANGLAEDEEGIEGGIFGAPTYADDDAYGAVEVYDDATVSHDYPVSPLLPPRPEGGDPWGSRDFRAQREWDRVNRERERIRDEWLRDPRNTVTITSKTPLGERLLAAAHKEVTA